MSTRSSGSLWSVAAVTLALAMLPAGAGAAVSDLTFGDVTPSAFSVIWASDAPVDDASVRVFADSAGTTELTASLEIELASSSDSLALGIVKLRVIGLESDTCVYVQTLTQAGGADTLFPPVAPFREVCTQTAQDRFDALGLPIANDILRLAVFAPDGVTPANGSLVLVAAPGFAKYPLSAFVGEGTVSGVARVNLNNLFATQTGITGRTPQNTVLRVTEFRGLTCSGLVHHKLVRFRYVPDHEEAPIVGAEITELEEPELCDPADGVCDGTINVLDAQRVANLFGRRVGECAYNSDLDVGGAPASPAGAARSPGVAVPAASGGDGIIDIRDVQLVLSAFKRNPGLARRLAQAKNQLCLNRAVRFADDELAQILDKADPVADADTVETATAFRAFTRVLRPLVDGQANATPEVDSISEVLARLGFSPTERNLFELPSGRLFNDDGTCVPPIAPLRESDVERALRAELLPRLEESLAALEGFRSDWTTTCYFVRMGAITPIEIDSSDLLLLRSMEHALRAALGLLEAYELDFDLGDACAIYNSTVPLCEDTERTIFAGGPGDGACRQFSDNPASCEDAWHRTASGDPASCFVSDGECLGCGPNNETAGLCTNTCGTPEIETAAIQTFLDAHLDFLTLQDPGASQAAGGEATAVVGLFGDALSAMREETDDPLDDLFSLTPRGVQFLDEELPDVLTSLGGTSAPAPQRAMCPVVETNLGTFFEGIGLRSLLPPFPDDVADLTQLPDPTFAGTLPGATLDEVLCLLDLEAPELVGLPVGQIEEAVPFRLEFDVVDPPSRSAPGRSVDPASLRLWLSEISPIPTFPEEGTCALSINGVGVAPPDPAAPVDVTVLFGRTQNADGSIHVAADLDVVGTPERGCFVTLEVEAADQSGNEVSEFVALELITAGAIARFDPPGGSVSSGFTLRVELEAPFGDVDALDVELSAFSCGEVIVNGEPLDGEFFGPIRDLLIESVTGPASRTLTGTIAVGAHCAINASVPVSPTLIKGVFYEVVP